MVDQKTMKVEQNKIDDLNKDLGNFQDAVKKFKNSVESSVDKKNQEKILKQIIELEKLEKFEYSNSLDKIVNRLDLHKKIIETFKLDFFTGNELAQLKNKVTSEKFVSTFEIKVTDFYDKITFSDSEIQKDVEKSKGINNSRLGQKLEEWGWTKTAATISGIGSFLGNIWDWITKKKKKTNIVKDDDIKNEGGNDNNGNTSESDNSITGTQNPKITTDTRSEENKPVDEATENENNQNEDGSGDEITENDKIEISDAEKLLNENNVDDISYDKTTETYTFLGVSIVASQIANIEELNAWKKIIADEQNKIDNPNSNIEDENQDDDLNKDLENKVIVGTVTTGTILGGGSAVGIKKALKGPKYTSEAIDVSAHRTTMKRFENLIGDEINNNNKLGKYQKERLTDYKKMVGETSAGLDNTMKGLDSRKKLGKQIPPELFQSRDISEADNNAMKKIISSLNNEDFIKLNKLKAKFSGNDLITEWQKYLKTKKIAIDNPKVLKLLSAAEDLDTMKHVAQVVGNAKGIAKMGKVVFSIGLDAVGFLFDIWARADGIEEADRIATYNKIKAQNQIDRTNFKFGVGIGFSVLGLGAGIGIALASSGPPGWIIIAGAAVLVSVEQSITYAADKLYFDVVDYYSQAAQLLEVRTKTKQFVYATMFSDMTDKQSLTEWTALSVNNSRIKDRIGLDVKINKKEAAERGFEALIFMERIQELNEKERKNFGLIQKFIASGKSKEAFIKILKDTKSEGYNSKYAEEFEKQWQNLVGVRLRFIKENYINIYMNKKGSKDKNKAFQLDDIENWLTNAKIYEEMNKDTNYKGEKNEEKYIEYKFQILKNKDPKVFLNLQDMQEKHPDQLIWIYHGAKNYESFLTPKENESDERKLLRKNILFIKDFVELNQSILSVEDKSYTGSLSFRRIEKDNGNIDFHKFEYGDIENSILKLSEENYTEQKNLRNNKKIENFFSTEQFSQHLEAEPGYSDSMGQNILFEMLKKFHGYNGSDNMMQMISFAKEGYADQIGFYYDEKKGRYSNINNALDEKLKLYKFDKINNLNNIETLTGKKINNIDEAADAIIFDIFIRKNKDNLDTPIESPDDELNKQFFLELKNAVKLELEAKLDKAKIRNEVLEYIKKHTKDQTEKYVLLPTWLTDKAIRVGLGDLRYFFFRYEPFEENNETLKAEDAMGYRGYFMTNPRKHKLIIKTSPAYQNKIVEKGFYSLAKIEFAKQVEKREITDQEKEKIAYVDNMKQKLIASMTINEESFALTTEYKYLIEKSIDDREFFKKDNMIRLDGKRQLEDSFDKYNRIFEGWYIALLNKVWISRYDIKSITSIPNIMLNYVDNSMLTYNKTTGLKIKPEQLIYGQTKLLDEILAMYKFFDGKIHKKLGSNITINKLLENEKTKKLGLAFVRQIVFAIIEESTLRKGESGDGMSVDGQGTARPPIKDFYIYMGENNKFAVKSMKGGRNSENAASGFGRNMKKKIEEFLGSVEGKKLLEEI